MELQKFEMWDGLIGSYCQIEPGSRVNWVASTQLKNQTDLKILSRLVENIGRGPFEVISIDQNGMIRIKVKTKQGERDINSIFLTPWD